MLLLVWRLTRGYRLQPWRSPYLRWRVETYCGLHAESMTDSEFRQFCWANRAALLRYLGWGARMSARRP